MGFKHSKIDKKKILHYYKLQPRSLYIPPNSHCITRKPLGWLDHRSSELDYGLGCMATSPHPFHPTTPNYSGCFVV
jgi:hypothetical protein